MRENRTGSARGLAGNGESYLNAKKMNCGIYIYFDGSDLYEVADSFREEMRSFLANHRSIKFVNALHPRDPAMKEDDSTDWAMGINLELSDHSMDDFESIFSCFTGIAAKYDRDFAVGYCEPRTGMNEDIGFLEKGMDFSETLNIIEQLKNS